MSDLKDVPMKYLSQFLEVLKTAQFGKVVLDENGDRYYSTRLYKFYVDQKIPEIEAEIERRKNG